MIMRKSRENLFGGTFKRRNIFINAKGYNGWFKRTVIRTIISLILLIIIIVIQISNFEQPKKILGFIKTGLESDFSTAAYLARAKNLPGYISAFGDKAMEVMKIEHGSNKRLGVPIDGEITTYFNEKIDETSNISRGLIFISDADQDIYSVDDGVVIDAGSNKSVGNYIIIKHKGELLSVYKHIGTNHTNINQKVGRGQVIGISSGRLLLEIWYRNEPINPIEYMGIDI